MKTDESGKDLKRLLRGFSLRGAKHKTNWPPFEITNKGIFLRNEKALRCDMCSRQIEWDPIVEVVEGKKYNFDCQDCAQTYKKIKSYTTNISSKLHFFRFFISVLSFY